MKSSCTQAKYELTESSRDDLLSWVLKEDRGGGGRFRQGSNVVSTSYLKLECVCHSQG